MDVASPYHVMSSIIALIMAICNGAFAGWPHVATASERFTRLVRRQLLDGAIADADKISDSFGSEPIHMGAKGLNPTPIVWICLIFVAVILLVVFCVLAHRRQNKRDEREGGTRNDEERRLPQLGIVR